MSTDRIFSGASRFAFITPLLDEGVDIERTEMHRFPQGYERDLFDWLFPILVLALLAALLLTLVWSLRQRPLPSGVGKAAAERVQSDAGDNPAMATPLQDAAMRLARAEITIDEFDSIRERLETEETTD
jgi:hypothetical protein